MTPEEIAAFFSDALDGTARSQLSFGAVTVDVPPDRWVEAATVARDQLSAGFFDVLSAYDELDSGFAVVVHLWSVEQRHSVTLRTRVPRDAARLPTLTGVFRGANWHEREMFEMFGIVFEGHPRLVPLLLPDGFEGHPLRKEFVLASRVTRPWPGAKEPGESAEGAPSRRKVQALGVPDPAEWGPEAMSTAPSATEGPPASGTIAPNAGTSNAGEAS